MFGLLRTALWAVVFCSACCAEVRVVVMTNSRPCAWEKEPGVFDGASVAIWEQVAREHDIRFRYVPAGPNVHKALARLEKKDFDILVGPISVTEERYNKFVFSRPYFLNHLSVLLPAHNEDSRWKMLGRALWQPVSYVLPILGVVIFVMTMFFYFFDRKVRNRQASLFRGLMDSFWEVIIILIQGELLEDTRHTGKRILVLFWLVSSIGLLSVVIGTITSSMTLFDEKLERSYRIVRSDLESEKVSVVKGSVGEKEAHRVLALPVGVDSRRDAVDLLKQRKVFGMIDDFLILKSLSMEYKGLRTTRLNLKNDEVAFAFHTESSLVRSVNSTLLKSQDNGTSETMCRPYLGDDAVLCIL